MELLQKTKTFTNKEGKEVQYNVYYVVAYGEEVELKPVNDTDKRLLKAAFKNGK